MSKKSSWWSDRHRKYKYTDKRDGLEYDLTLDQAKAVMSLPCFYCCKPESKGLDRISNDIGHTVSNIVPCCGICNLMLASTPWAAKLEMRESLRSIRDKNLLGDWKPPYLSAPKPKVESKEVDSESCDASTTITEIMSEQIAKEIDKEILDHLDNFSETDILRRAAISIRDDIDHQILNDMFNESKKLTTGPTTVTWDEYIKNKELYKHKESIGILDNNGNENENVRMWIVRQVKDLDEEI